MKDCEKILWVADDDSVYSLVIEEKVALIEFKK